MKLPEREGTSERVPDIDEEIGTRRIQNGRIVHGVSLDEPQVSPEERVLIGQVMTLNVLP